MLTNRSVTELAELTGFSKSYISQVKNGSRPPSDKLILRLKELVKPKQPKTDYLAFFFESRKAMGVSPKTLSFYQQRLGQFVDRVSYLKASKTDIERFLNSIPANENGLSTRHASYRAIKTFYLWLASNHGIESPMTNLSAPILSKVIMPTLTKEQVQTLIEYVPLDRDKAIIALFVESGLRLSELANIRVKDIDWAGQTIRTVGKGRKEADSPLGRLSADYLRVLVKDKMPDSSVWDISARGIQIMLNRLERSTGIKANPHTFRRTFACLLRKAGIDTMTIQQLGRWESISMVQRYTRAFTFQDSLRFYKAPLG